jgi:hypothetical protein
MYTKYLVAIPEEKRQLVRPSSRWHHEETRREDLYWIQLAQDRHNGALLCTSNELRRLLNPKGSSPCSQELATGPYPEPDESGLHPKTAFLELHFNIIVPSTFRSFNSPRCLSFRFRNEFLDSVNLTQNFDEHSYYQLLIKCSAAWG